ncbi:Gfo/Idh/MocA family protein [Niallia taxi]|uniref:Gfo/Idh/MocA family protein n=1 Tax=Niallia taxi TaxID=2499688 RepID=UPI0015F5DE5A|nr:Gfo/Idh/MocA family oxidoreductase [Niallia taxi]
MIRFGIVGSNWITERFIKAGRQHEQFLVSAVYSRSKEKAQEFAKKQQIKHAFHNLDEMAASTEIDAVYIATPNSLHCEQAILFMNNKKHVICEKPFASNREEAEKMMAAAKNNGVSLMEAMKSTLMPNFLAVKENIHKIGKIQSYFSANCRLSPFYEQYKNGEMPNLFNPKLSGGALMDLGVYTVYPIVELFGAPKSIAAFGNLLSTGVDGNGQITLEYDGFRANVLFSCISESTLPTEIQGEAGTMLIHHISSPKKTEILIANGTTEDISESEQLEPMYYEIKEFIETIQSNTLESPRNTWAKTLLTMEILDEARRQMKVTMADKS